jgi:hypothetical protein
MLRYPERCFTSYEVNIGYYAMRTTVACAMLYGSDDRAPVKDHLVAGQRVGLQSVRNPNFLARPEPRNARNGYVWCFALAGGESGWVPQSCLRPDDPHEEPWADGPASADFEVGLGYPKAKRRPRFMMSWKPKTSPHRIVTADNVYIRYSVRGTAFDFLLRGERVEIRHVHPMGFVCVKVTEARFCPEGTIGWVQLAALRRP